MIITRTPFRISFFGGGTDFPVWYREHGGMVISTTIDKYCYVSCRYLPPFFDYKHRLVYSRAEHVNKIDEILHPAIRETFRFMSIGDKGLEIHHDGDLPARSGLGSSSAFTVGLLNALYAFHGKIASKKRLAMEAIHIEQEMIRESVGSQDQVASAFGGLNKIVFRQDMEIEVNPIIIPQERKKSFHDHLVLFFTGFSRDSQSIEKEKIEAIKSKHKELSSMQRLVETAVDILIDGDLEDFGALLNETWHLKKSLSKKVSTSYVDYVYDYAMKNGAIGGKLLGAGGGGFMLFFVSPNRLEQFLKSMSFLLHVPFKFDNIGSQIIYYREEDI